MKINVNIYVIYMEGLWASTGTPKSRGAQKCGWHQGVKFQGLDLMEICICMSVSLAIFPDFVCLDK